MSNKHVDDGVADLSQQDLTGRLKKIEANIDAIWVALEHFKDRLDGFAELFCDKAD